MVASWSSARHKPAEPGRATRDAGSGTLNGPLPKFSMIAIMAACLLLAVLLVLEIAAGWEQLPLPLHLLTIIALVGIYGAALANYRWLLTVPENGASVAKLQRALEAADTANLAKSRYLTNVSHEIRSPLNAIYGYAQLIEQDGADAGDGARIIRRCAEHLASLVEGLLDIAQVENGVLRLRFEAVRLGPFVEQIVAMMQPAAKAKGLDLVYEPPARLPEFVRMDQSRLRQVLINLLSNAIKFTDRGHVTLRVIYTGQIATFEVIDTGPGIAPEDQERIFEPFEQAEAGAGAAHPGAGIGLSISRTIAQILGGTLELAASSPEGSRFRTKLMLPEVVGQAVTEMHGANCPIGYAGARRSILIVDDDFEQRSFLDRWLAAIGFTVTAVPSGEAAVELSRRGDFDLALLDISLPGMSGWQTAAALRARYGRDIRIVMVSANAHEAHRPPSPEEAHDHFLLKPFAFDALIQAMESLLGLTWHYHAAEPEAAAGHAPQMGQLQLSADARLHVERIRELLRIGYIRGVEAEIRQLAESAPQARELIDRLYVQLDRFDLGGIARILESI